MALPAEFDKACVHGKYVNLDGTVPTGRVTFAGGIMLRATGVDTVILPSSFTVTLDAQGEFTVILPTTDDPDITPYDWLYEVTESFNTFSRTYWMEVPYDTVGCIEIADLEIPLGGNVAIERGRYVESINGQVGTVTLAMLATGTANNTTFLRGDGTWAVPAGQGGGVTDHGSLTGLLDDDHPQYYNQARGDARYVQLTTRGTANGVAALDSTARVPLAQLGAGTLGTTVFLRGDGTWATPPTGSGTGGTGTTDHHLLTNLTTYDDHTQYHNDARGDARYVQLGSKGVLNGVASLDGTGKVPTTQLPSLAINDTFVVSSEAAMTALTAQRGDMAIRTDINSTFVLASDVSTIASNWLLIRSPGGSGGGSVTTVNGHTGDVTLALGDLGDVNTGTFSINDGDVLSFNASTTFWEPHTNVPAPHTHVQYALLNHAHPYMLQGLILPTGYPIPDGTPDGIIVVDRPIPTTSYLGDAGANAQDAGTTLDILVTRSILVGQLIVVGVVLDGVGAVTDTLSATDTSGNAYFVRRQRLTGSTVQVGILSAICTSPVTAGQVITVTSSTNRQAWSGVVGVADGIDNLNPFDVSGVGGSTAATAVSIGPVTTTSAPQVAIGIVGYDPSGRTFTPGTNWNLSAGTENTGIIPRRAQLMYRTLGVTGSYTATGTLSTAGAYAGVIATFRGA